MQNGDSIPLSLSLPLSQSLSLTMTLAHTHSHTHTHPHEHTHPHAAATRFHPNRSYPKWHFLWKQSKLDARIRNAENQTNSKLVVSVSSSRRTEQSELDHSKLSFFCPKKLMHFDTKLSEDFQSRMILVSIVKYDNLYWTLGNISKVTLFSYPWNIQTVNATRSLAGFHCTGASRSNSLDWPE